ncbi:hypothetical protein FHX40_4329 [Thermopolyspora flexuosa]|uniref:Uncharacterized protein n=1 Tax=Thermopolyspora flexuosa TaxID=103836 RepID=A0A543J423_9ACTN|nr:hypothetical protein FHX40_4329 [Thermopolyspora flexuosa]
MTSRVGVRRTIIWHWFGMGMGKGPSQDRKGPLS